MSHLGVVLPLQAGILYADDTPVEQMREVRWGCASLLLVEMSVPDHCEIHKHMTNQLVPCSVIACQ